NIEVEKNLVFKTNYEVVHTVEVLTIENAEVNETVTITLNPADHLSCSGSLQAKHVINLVQEDMTASIQLIIGIVLLTPDEEEIVFRDIVPVIIRVIEELRIHRWMTRRR